jgi:uncharacterized protein (DUF1330 family)
MMSLMKTFAILAIGVALGATAVGSLNARGKAPVYVITDFTEITDPAALMAGAGTVPAAIKAGGGKVVARTDNVVPLDGAVPKRYAIFSFDSVDQAKAWYSS